jgi:DNA mismatch repair protein MutS
MTTPARRQYLRIKKEHPGEVLLFRMGDFYETFDDDARTISRELEIALTSREMGKGPKIPLAGIPYHALEPYLARLINKGYKVAICEQTSDPAASKGIVDREVVRVVTAGTVVEESILDGKANNYLAAVVVDETEAGLAFVDITTSEFATGQFPKHGLVAELGRLAPAELLVVQGQELPTTEPGVAVTLLDAEAFHLEWATENLLKHFGVASLEAFGCDKLPLAARAAGAIVDYLAGHQRTALPQITSLYTYHTGAHMVLDPQTTRNLEIFAGGRGDDPKASLLFVLDTTRTAMGGRLLRSWLSRPLMDLEALERRQDAVAWFVQSALRRGRVVTILDSISDLERLTNRVRGGTATPRDLVALGRSLEAAPQLRAVMEEDEDAPQVAWLSGGIGDNREVAELLRAAIEDDPPASLSDGGVIRRGFSTDLDALRDTSRSAQAYIAGLETTERERTGIGSLKVGYNRVFGYYIEVSKANASKVPEEYIRRQTLVGGERYITPEMKEYESRVVNAQERIVELESTLFRQVCQQAGDGGAGIMAMAGAVARTDALCSLGEVAARNGYVRPRLDDGGVTDVIKGRHPVVERTLPAGAFVSNDVRLGVDDDQLIVLTGPNMSGKSTFIRQVAIITLMAQVGSFVPAESATIGVVDRIFTRIGLQDDLSVGQSTFMVEMVETATILNHATPRSLVVLDEIGRGTSTYDGLAIARAVAEYIHSHPRLGCRTLFATHYHELTALADTLPRVRNFNVAVSEDRGDVVFLRRIVPGGADKSYGVHVARIAGLPGAVVNRAWEVLRDLERDAAGPRLGEGEGVSEEAAVGTPGPGEGTAPLQLPLMSGTPASVSALLALDIASMTPLEAITALYELQEQAKAE